MKCLLCFYLSFITLLAHGQVSIKRTTTQEEIKIAEACGGMDLIMKRKGSWKKSEDDLAFPDKAFPRSQYKFINARIDSMHALLRQSIPDLSGFEPNWYRSIRGDSYLSNGPVPYSLSTLYFEYYCNTNVNEILLADETGINIKIFVNDIPQLFSKVDEWVTGEDGKLKAVYRLPPKAGTWKNLTVYEISGYHYEESRAVLMGRNGKVPWRTLTQKEYLTGLKNQYEKMNENQPLANSEKQRLGYVTTYLTTTDTGTLNKPAIIDPKAGVWGFKGKFGNENDGGFRLVFPVLSDKYFDASLPRYAPQVIVISWSYLQSPPALNVKNQFEKNFPVEKLKAMIDK
jgi:hypothetical protein